MDNGGRETDIYDLDLKKKSIIKSNYSGELCNAEFIPHKKQKSCEIRLTLKYLWACAE